MCFLFGYLCEWMYIFKKNCGQIKKKLSSFICWQGVFLYRSLFWYKIIIMPVLINYVILHRNSQLIAQKMGTICWCGQPLSSDMLIILSGFFSRSVNIERAQNHFHKHVKRRKNQSETVRNSVSVERYCQSKLPSIIQWNFQFDSSFVECWKSKQNARRCSRQ